MSENVQGWIAVGQLILMLNFVVYYVTGLCLFIVKSVHKSCAPRVVNQMWRWTKWPSLVGILCDIPAQLLYGGEVNWLDYLMLGLNLFTWYTFRNSGDDDPMDKLKDKIKEMVEEVNGRLVLVPVSN